MDNYCLPESFIEEIISLGRDRIDEVKVAVDDRIKTGANVIDSEGKLDVSIFSWKNEVKKFENLRKLSEVKMNVYFLHNYNKHISVAASSHLILQKSAVKFNPRANFFFNKFILQFY